jgi:hypothetical protein
MRRVARITGVVLVVVLGSATPASADWLFTGYINWLKNVETTGSTTLASPAEKFDDSLGFGINFASAFPSRNNLGFEFDWGIYPEGLQHGDVFGDVFKSRLMSISTNFFFSPAVPRVRPYLTVGPNFAYRWDYTDVQLPTPSGWSVGVNAGGGVIAFINRRVGARMDVRYARHFGEFYDLREEALTRRTGWSDLQYLRAFAGLTFVIH